MPLSTGITYALMEKVPGDKIPLLNSGYGRSESGDGNVIPWSFPILGTYWDAADIAMTYIVKEGGGWVKLKDKKIALVYHHSPYGMNAIPLFQSLGNQHGLVVDVL